MTIDQPPALMTGVVLAGGRGSRLGRLTRSTSKQLLPVAGRPLVVRVIDQLVAAGIDDVIVIIDDRHACDYLRTLRDGQDLGLRSLAYLWQSPAGLGLPTAIAAAEHHLRTDKFIVACGDVLLEADLKPVAADFAAQAGGARLPATQTADTAGYTRLEVAGDRVMSLADKDPAQHGPGWIDLGIYLYHHDVFAMIKSLRPSKRGETEIWDLNRRYAQAGKLAYTEVTGWWIDVGMNQESYRRASQRYIGR